MSIDIDRLSTNERIVINFSNLDKILEALEYFDDNRFCQDSYLYAIQKKIINPSKLKKLNTYIVLFSKLRNSKNYPTVTCRDECEMILSYLNYCIQVTDIGPPVKFSDVFIIKEI